MQWLIPVSRFCSAYFGATVSLSILPSTPSFLFTNLSPLTWGVCSEQCTPPTAAKRCVHHTLYLSLHDQLWCSCSPQVQVFSFSWTTPPNTWLSLFQTLILSFASAKLFFAKSWFQDRAQKINNSSRCLPQRKWDPFPSFHLGGEVWLAQEISFVIWWPYQQVLCLADFPLREKTYFILTVFLLSSQPHYHPTVLFAFGSSPRMVGWKQKPHWFCGFQKRPRLLSTYFMQLCFFGYLSHFPS